MIKFYPYLNDDKRMLYASKYLENNGAQAVGKIENADFILCPINPKNLDCFYPLPVLAGNVEEKDNVFDYTADESFALQNAYLTAQGAIAEASQFSDFSLVGSRVLLLGFGRISKALLSFLSPITNKISVCARNPLQRKQAELLGGEAFDFDELFRRLDGFDFIFNTVAHPVLCRKELEMINKECTIIDLASFPGGADNHFASVLGVNLVVARGLPGKYFPKTSGRLVAESVIKILKREGIAQ